MARGHPRLSIIIPCYNEADTLTLILRKVCRTLPQVSKEIVIIDDCSSDGSRELIVRLSEMAENEWQDFVFADDRSESSSLELPQLHAVFHKSNGGKGTAIRSGLAHARGDILVIQDADLEYDPEDWGEMFALIDQGHADVVYGSRFYGRPHRSLYYHHYFGNRLISRGFNLLYNQILTDIETCYKMFRREAVHGITFTSRDFGIEVELSAAIVLARRWRIYEMGIRYFGRTYDEGKKINWRDGVKAMWYLVKFRFRDYTPNSSCEGGSAPRERRRAYLQGGNEKPSALAQPGDQRSTAREGVELVDEAGDRH